MNRAADAADRARTARADRPDRPDEEGAPHRPPHDVGTCSRCARWRVENRRVLRPAGRGKWRWERRGDRVRPVDPNPDGDPWRPNPHLG